MKSILYVVLCSVLFMSCQNNKQTTLVPRALGANEDFNQFPKENSNTLTITETAGSDKGATEKDAKEQFNVKIGDSTIRIQTNPADQNSATDQFSFAQFVNTQKTSLLVQIKSTEGLVAPFYLISLKDGKVEAVSIYRASKGSQDVKYTTGVSRIGRSGFLVNNDFFITTVNAKVYEIKRQNPEERIQGLFIVNSPDKNTLGFLVGPAIYQVHYLTGETYSQPLPAAAPKEPEALVQWIQSNFSWQKNQKEIYFLKVNADDNRVRDIKEFK